MSGITDPITDLKFCFGNPDHQEQWWSENKEVEYDPAHFQGGLRQWYEAKLQEKRRADIRSHLAHLDNLVAKTKFQFEIEMLDNYPEVAKQFTLRSRFVEHKTILDGMHVMYTATKDENTRQRAEIQVLNQRLSESGSTITQLKAEMTAVRGATVSISFMYEELAKLEKSVRMRARAEAEAEITRLTATLAEHIRKVDRLENETRERERNATTLKSELEDCERKLAERTHEITDLKSELEDRERKLAERTHEITDLKSELEDRERKLAERTHEVTDLKSELEDRERKLAERTREVTDLKHQIAERDADRAASEQITHKAGQMRNDEIENLKKLNADLIAEVKSLRGSQGSHA
jgi:chromosome segregation ATPase